MQTLLHRPDFRRRPLRAIGRRLWWRCRWSCNDAPWLLPLGGESTILVPRSGAGALLYYQGSSEPEISTFIRAFLKPGMIFFDLGAHIGEYTLLASKQVGPAGQVHSFEPQPDTFDLLTRNVHRNHAANVFLNSCAIADHDDVRQFIVSYESSESSIAPTCPTDGNSGVRLTLSVRVRRLDSYCEEVHLRPNLIKADVEGAELMVLRGAEGLLNVPQDEAPVWVLEYSPATYSRFGSSAGELFDLMESRGYALFTLTTSIPKRIRREEVASLGDATRNLIATKRHLLDCHTR